jgi:hypothetical protein
VKLVLSLLVAIACLFASPALAQGTSSLSDAGRMGEPDTQILGFIRIPLGEQSKKPNDPVVGFGLFADCSRTSQWRSAAHASACDSQPIRSLEFAREFGQRDWLLSFTGEKRWVGIARWFPHEGFARVREFGPVLDGPDQNFRVN